LVFNELRAAISFLSVIPISRFSIIDINDVALGMHFFPLVGAILGFGIGALAYVISFYLPPLVVGFVVVFSLVMVSGINHIDALADFADGMMSKGGKDAKHRAMNDPTIGSAGAVALILYISGMIIVVSSFSTSSKLLFSIFVSEVIAKYTMVLQANVGHSAWEGSSSPFTKAMKDRRRIIAATGFMLPLVCIATGLIGIMSLTSSTIIAMLVQYCSNRNLGGISGDVLGASNEISRLSSLIVTLSFNW
jgi:adenosylcobinamide-GDP ribazoletransferase